MNPRFVRGLAFALPLSLALWVATAAGAVVVIDYHYPGFRHKVTTKIVKIARTLAS